MAIMKPAGSNWKINCQEARTPMLLASMVQLVSSFLMVAIGATVLGMCNKNRFGDWGLVYGGALFATSLTTTAAIHGRLRRAALFALGFGTLASFIALVIDGIGYFCIDLNGGANQETEFCKTATLTLNPCVWSSEWTEDKKYERGGELRLALLFIVLLHLVTNVGIATTTMTVAGRVDLCQFEDALRALRETNMDLNERDRAKRNRILTTYVSQAKPEEGRNVFTRISRWLGFGVDVEPVPAADRKIQIVRPAGAKAVASKPLG